MNPQRLNHKQHGAVLVVGLIFLLLMSVVGLTSLQRVTIQERVTGNSVDSQRAFQAAEIALSNAELLAQTPAINDFVRVIAQGQASDAELLLEANWVCDDTTVAVASRCIQNSVPLITGLTQNPRMKFEELATDRYRITVWASGIGRSKVLLQSEYKRP